MEANSKFSLYNRRIIFTLFIIYFLLLISHIIAIQIFYNPEFTLLKTQLGISEEWQISIFDLDSEESFGTYFSSIILLFAGLLILIKYKFLSKFEKKWRFHWIILGLGFCLMSMEEIVGIHELINTYSKDVYWTISSLYLLIPIGIYYLPFIWHYKGRLSTMLLVSGVIYVSGAIITESFIIEDTYSLGYNMKTTLEECLEMLGVIMLIITMNYELRKMGLKIQFKVDKKE